MHLPLPAVISVVSDMQIQLAGYDFQKHRQKTWPQLDREVILSYTEFNKYTLVISFSYLMTSMVYISITH